jgi:plasmid stabilization system protein ParE
MSRYKAMWAPIAEADVEAIYEWIAHRDGRRQTAKKIVREIRQKCDEYAGIFASGSVIGTARPDLGESHRVVAHKRWVIMFRPIEGSIEVLRVLDGSRDYTQLFRA